MPVNIGDAVDGVLVSAIGLAGRRIGVAFDGLRGRERAPVQPSAEGSSFAKTP
ncbi:MAG: hypothetical protein ABSB59_00340 [Streptosporangiaceae bacterium]|jgi:hypothetical protein